MTEMEQIKNLFKVGTEFEEYYGNGERQTQLHDDGSRTPAVGTVVKISEKSCWIGCSRMSWNTIKEYYEKGLYKEI